MSLMRTRRLSSNDEKSELIFSSKDDFRTIITNEFRLLCLRIKTVEVSNLKLFGSTSEPKSIETIFNDKLKAVIVMKERLKQVLSHCALFLLTNCFLMYFFRTSEDNRRIDLLQTLEDKIINGKHHQHQNE